MQGTNVREDFFNSENNWIESKSLQLLTEKVATTQLHAFFATILLFAMLYSYTSLNNWLVWLTVHVLVIALRLWFVGRHHSRYEKNFNYQQIGFYYRYSFIIISISFSWVASAYLVGGNEPSLITALCFNFILVYGVVATINLACLPVPHMTCASLSWHWIYMLAGWQKTRLQAPKPYPKLQHRQRLLSIYLTPCLTCRA